jgi:hypothetical protein
MALSTPTDIMDQLERARARWLESRALAEKARSDEHAALETFLELLMRARGHEDDLSSFVDESEPVVADPRFPAATHAPLPPLSGLPTVAPGGDSPDEREAARPPAAADTRQVPSPPPSPLPPLPSIPGVSEGRAMVAAPGETSSDLADVLLPDLPGPVLPPAQTAHPAPLVAPPAAGVLPPAAPLPSSVPLPPPPAPIVHPSAPPEMPASLPPADSSTPLPSGMSLADLLGSADATLRVPAAEPRSNRFLSESVDPASRATRLARTLVGDIIAYRPEEHHAALADGVELLRDRFRDDIESARAEFNKQVDPDDVEDRDELFRHALNEILCHGQQVF